MMFKTSTFAIVAASSALLVSGAQAANFAVTFSANSGNVNQTGTGGLFFNGVTGNSPTKANLIATDGTTPTGVALSTVDAGAFSSNDRGNNIPITFNGITFPGVVNDGYLADNFDAGGRDGLISLRFTAPGTPEFQQFQFTFTTSFDLNNPPAGTHLVQYNVGGTYSAATKSFTGGTTVQLDAGDDDNTPNLDAGTLTANANLVGSNYVIDFQIGYAGAGNNSVGAINGLHVSTSAVPEPASLSLIALGAIPLLRRRRGR